VSYQIRRTPYGFRFEHEGCPSTADVEAFCAEARDAIDDTWGSFCVLSDQRQLELFPRDGAAELGRLMAHAGASGLQRSVAVVGSVTCQMQVDRLVANARDGDESVVVRASDHDDPISVAEAWVRDGVHPDAAATR
jgi:hypothetical protein